MQQNDLIDDIEEVQPPQLWANTTAPRTTEIPFYRHTDMRNPMRPRAPRLIHTKRKHPS